MAGDVLENDPSEPVAKLAGNPSHVRPEVPLVGFSLALSGLAERLAGVSGKEGVNSPGERARVEGGEVVPDRGGGEVSGPLRRDENVTGILFPLDIASGLKAGLCEHEAHIQSSAAAAQGESVSGTWHHIHGPFLISATISSTGRGTRPRPRQARHIARAGRNIARVPPSIGVRRSPSGTLPRPSQAGQGTLLPWRVRSGITLSFPAKANSSRTALRG